MLAVKKQTTLFLSVLAVSLPTLCLFPCKALHYVVYMCCNYDTTAEQNKYRQPADVRGSPENRKKERTTHPANMLFEALSNDFTIPCVILSNHRQVLYDWPGIYSQFSQTLSVVPSKTVGVKQDRGHWGRRRGIHVWLRVRLRIGRRKVRYLRIGLTLRIQGHLARLKPSEIDQKCYLKAAGRRIGLKRVRESNVQAILALKNLQHCFRNRKLDEGL